MTTTPIPAHLLPRRDSGGGSPSLAPAAPKPRALRYLSVCSGIEAATQAWRGLGWEPVAFSEIEKFPCAVLAHHYPTTPNWGDMTKFQEWPDADLDVLCGGTPCQSFSVAGLRQGLADPRGNLMLTFGAIAARYRPRWLCWENVPGVLSSEGGRDFASLLGLLTGRAIDVHEGGWGNSGIIPGIADAYGIAYRVLDAQYVRTRRSRRAVPQRRRRVFVVGYLGDWRRAAAVLFDAESLRRDPPPRREAGQGVAPTISARPTGGGGLGTDFDLDGGVICADVNPTLNAHFGEKQGLEDQHVNGGCGMFVAEVAPTLRGEGFDATDDGTGKGTPIIPVLFDSKGSQVQTDETSAAPTLRAMTHAESHQNGGGQLAVAFQDRTRGDDGRGYDRPPPISEEVVGTLETVKHWNVATPWAVRRLTPVECERLMDFPDGFTRIPYRGKPADLCPDGPRYKALGNSWAVNVAEWVGERIAEVDTWGPAPQQERTHAASE